MTIVVEQVADQLISAMVRQGAFKLSPSQLDKLMGQITVDVNGHRQVNRKYVGKDVQVILSSIGVTVGSDVRLAMAEVPADHPLVFLEQLMPVMPIVRVPNVDQAIELAYQAEQGNFHTAMMHSRNVDNLSKMARRMQVSVFVKNGPSYAGLGMYGEGHNSTPLLVPLEKELQPPRFFSGSTLCSEGPFQDRLRSQEEELCKLIWRD